MRDELSERRDRKTGELQVGLGPRALAVLAAYDRRMASRPGEHPAITKARRILERGSITILLEQAMVREGYLRPDWRDRAEDEPDNVGDNSPTARRTRKRPRKPAADGPDPKAEREARKAAAVRERRAAAEQTRAERRRERDARRTEEREPVPGQCIGTVRSGRRCRLLSVDGTDRCEVHRT